MAKLSDHILFSTELLPTQRPDPKTWPYFGLDHGQHISFYSRRSLEIIAEKLGFNFYTNGVSLHLLTRVKISPWLFKLTSRSRVARMIDVFTERPSLIEADLQKALKRQNGN